MRRRTKCLPPGSGLSRTSHWNPFCSITKCTKCLSDGHCQSFIMTSEQLFGGMPFFYCPWSLQNLKKKNFPFSVPMRQTFFSQWNFSTAIWIDCHGLKYRYPWCLGDESWLLFWAPLIQRNIETSDRLAQRRVQTFMVSRCWRSLYTHTMRLTFVVLKDML